MKSKTVKIFVVILAAIGIIYWLLPQYARTALTYFNPGIEDYPIFENRIIEANNPIPWELHESFEDVRLAAGYEDTFMMLNSVAFIVIKDGKLFFEKYWDDYSEDSKSNSFSAAKSIVAFAVLKAVEEGYISSLDQKVCDFIPSYNTPSNKHLTIRNLLTMSSGLNWQENHKGVNTLFQTTTEAYYGRDLDKLIHEMVVVDEPGIKYKYLSGNTLILGRIVTNAVGKPLGEYVSEKLWTPLNAEKDALWCLDKKDGLEKGYCCFNTNARDFARWGQLMLDTGAWNGKQIIQKELMLEAISPATYLKDELGNTLDYYGQQVWILNYQGMKIPYMRGILGQYIMAVPEKNMVIVRLGHLRSDTRTGAHTDDVYYWVRAALKMVESSTQNKEAN